MSSKQSYTWYQGKSLNSYYRINAKGDKVYAAKGSTPPADFIPYASTEAPTQKVPAVPKPCKRQLVAPSLAEEEPDTPSNPPSSPEPLARAKSRAPPSAKPKPTDECTAEQELEALEEAYDHLCTQLEMVEARIEELRHELANDGDRHAN
jgi:hypothetical protein